MTTLKHPRLPHVTADVPESDVKRWEASGWVAPKAVVGEDGPEIESEPVKPRKRASRKK